jgi:threonine/homoserine/homoserine lactone efflux protein
MDIQLIIIYTTISALYIASPGPAVLLAILNSIRGDFKVVLVSNAANILGLIVLSSASILGLGLLIKSSELLFTLLKIIGAIYLAYIGYKLLKNNSTLDFNTNTKSSKKEYKVYFKESFITAITNPKPILFFTAIFPNFINYDSNIYFQFSVLTFIFVFLSFSILSMYGYLALKSKALLSNAKAISIFYKVSGITFIFLAIGLLQLTQ